MGARESAVPDPNSEEEFSDESDQSDHDDIGEIEENEEIIELNLGEEFAKELVSKFGNLLSSPLPPDGNPSILMPKSLGLQLFTIYAETIFDREYEKNKEKVNNTSPDETSRMEIEEGLMVQNDEYEDEYEIDGYMHSQEVLENMDQSDAHRKKFLDLQNKAKKCRQKSDYIKAKQYEKAAHLERILMKEKYDLAILDIRKQYLEANPEENHLLDLHRLSCKDALLLVNDFIDVQIEILQKRAMNLKSKKKKTFCQRIFIITGRGKHSDDGKPKIKPTVITYLRKKHFIFWQANEGCLTCLLTYKQPNSVQN